VEVDPEREVVACRAGLEVGDGQQGGGEPGRARAHESLCRSPTTAAKFAASISIEACARSTSSPSCGSSIA